MYFIFLFTLLTSVNSAVQALLWRHNWNVQAFMFNTPIRLLLNNIDPVHLIMHARYYGIYLPVLRTAVKINNTSLNNQYLGNIAGEILWPQLILWRVITKQQTNANVLSPFSICLSEQFGKTTKHKRASSVGHCRTLYTACSTGENWHWHTVVDCGRLAVVDGAGLLSWNDGVCLAVMHSV